TRPYLDATGSVVAAKQAKLQLDKESLKGKTIGAQTGSTYTQYLQQTYGDAVKVNTYASLQSAFLDLNSGRVDAVMGDTPTILQWIKTNPNFEIVGEPIKDEKFFGKGYGIAVKKGNDALLQKLNQALQQIKEQGTYVQIVDKYFMAK